MALAALLICAPACADNYLILPFFNLSKSPNLDWVGESLAETVREVLVSQGILALDRTARTEGFRRLSMKSNTLLTKASVIRLSESLDASHVIYGTFELLPSENAAAKGSLRIVANLINLQRAKSEPQYMELGALEDLARLQTHLAWQTLQFVSPKSVPSEQDYAANRPLMRVDAIESYVRALLAPSEEQKLRLYSQAVRIEPKYSQANFQLGRLQWQKKNYKLAAEALRKVGAKDAHYREASFLLGLAQFYLGDFAEAERAFGLVAAEVPLSEVLNNLAATQSRRNSPEALANFQRALEGDSNDPDYHFNVGYALYKRGSLPAAAERFRAVLDRDPDDATAITMLGRCLREPGTPRTRKTPAANDGLERLKEKYEESAYWQLKAVLEPKH